MLDAGNDSTRVDMVVTSDVNSSDVDSGDVGRGDSGDSSDAGGSVDVANVETANQDVGPDLAVDRVDGLPEARDAELRCSPNPCQHGGICTETSGTYVCACPPIFTGLNCELPRFVAIGPPPNDALAISADGQFIAGTVGAPGLAARWTAGGQLTLLGTYQSDQVSTALSISDDGSIVVGTSKTTVAGFARAIAWMNSVPVNLGAISGTTSCLAVATSHDGTITAGGCDMGPVPGSRRYAFRADASGLKDIGAISGSTVCDAFAMTRDGATIVGGCDVSAATHPFRWTAGAMSDLGLLADTTSCTARAIADNTGTIVGSCNSKAFTWTPSNAMKELPVRPNKESSIPRAISANGLIAVGYDYAGGGAPFDAVVWGRTAGQVETIASVLQNTGVDLTNWQLQTANAISADGKTVVGHGTNPSGIQQAWLARLP